MDWPDAWQGAFRVELRAEAIGLASRGWPVLPGTYPAGSRFTGGSGRAAGLRPVLEDWEQHLGADADQIARWWDRGPYNLLVATGSKLDAIEVGSELGRHTAAVLRSNHLSAPIAVTQRGRWLFLTAHSEEVSAELTGLDDLIVHGAGSWVPLPPTAFPQGIVHWRVRPEAWGWELPRPQVIQNAMIAALVGLRSIDAARSGFVGVDRAAA